MYRPEPNHTPNFRFGDDPPEGQTVSEGLAILANLRRNAVVPYQQPGLAGGNACPTKQLSPIWFLKLSGAGVSACQPGLLNRFLQVPR